MEKVLDKEKCVNCRACVNRCPKEAITMEEDNYGFFYPVINKEKCIDCGLCIKICPILNLKEKQKNYYNNKVYACYAKDKIIRKKSSSGGIFALLCQFILNQNGVIYAPAFDKNFNVHHIKVDKKEQLPSLLGSKYVESNIGNIYKNIEEYLKENKMVLFSGTPCQIAGLKHFLKKEYETLYTQDIICHGIPSNKVWKKYLENALIPEEISFRDKTYGWEDYSLKIKSKNKKQILSHNDDAYMQLYLQNLILRDSCYNCSFKDGNTYADITLGDFWGIKNFQTTLDYKDGVSLVIINDEKGKKLYESIQKEIIVDDSISLKDVVTYNSAIQTSVERNPKREAFFNDINTLSFPEIISKYTVVKTKKQLKIEYIKKKLKKILKG